MRISDWSSDVCSSDLVEPGGDLFVGPAFHAVQHQHRAGARRQRGDGAFEVHAQCGGVSGRIGAADALEVLLVVVHRRRSAMPAQRSEEHTSELQSLMRISYAVVYLKKKKANKALLGTN